MSEHIDYNALEAQLTDPGRAHPGGEQVKTGPAASTEGSAFLLREYGTQEAVAVALSPGRPRVGEPRRGPSPTVRARLSDADYSAFKRLEEVTGRTQSELVREAVHRLLLDHRLTG